MGKEKSFELNDVNGYYTVKTAKRVLYCLSRLSELSS